MLWETASFFCGWYVALQSFILQLLFKELCFQLWSISLIREINWLILRLLHRICFCLFSFVLKEFSIFLLIYGNADVGKKKKKKKIGINSDTWFHRGSIEIGKSWIRYGDVGPVFFGYSKHVVQILWKVYKKQSDLFPRSSLSVCSRFVGISPRLSYKISIEP